MSGVSANCYATKWHRRRGSNRNDGDDQRSRPSKPFCRAKVRASDRVVGLWFVFARGSYARPPVSAALPVFPLLILYTLFTKIDTLYCKPNPEYLYTNRAK